MPAYNFKREFAEAVEQGEKRQTIRKRRKRRTSEGDRLFLYTGMRTKGCRKLGEAVCTGVKGIAIRYDGVWMEGEELQNGEVLALAKADGFASVRAFYRFFRKQYELPFVGEVITW